MTTATYTILGYTVSTPDQVRSVLVVAKLKCATQAVDQCLSVLRKMEG
jgi:hypothetical protein